MPKATVIIPTYNRSNLVREAVESVLRQTFTDFELIVVDDGSTDDTREVIGNIMDDRIRYCYKPNGGGGSARNRGLIESQGEYIAFLDHDDLWLENYLSIMLQKLEEEREYGMAYSRYKNVYPDGREIERFGPDRYMSGCLTENFFGKTPCVLPSATCYRKSVFKGFFHDENLQNKVDVDFFLRLSAKTKFLCVPETFVIRRKVRDSMTFLSTGSICYTTALILERFYFQLGGDKIVPAAMAKRKISRKYRSLAKEHYKRRHRHAAISLFKKAISYYPFDYHYYKGLLKALLLKPHDDKIPNWEMPKPLPAGIMGAAMKSDYGGKCNTNNRAPDLF